MPAPQPLTRTPAPKLDFSRPGTPAASDFGDIYFSTDGGLAETRAVFLSGCGLPDRWMGRDVFTIAELGFGSGLNFLATCKSWAESGAQGRLHFISVEGFPFERDDLARALSAFPELATWAEPLIRSWPGPVKGIHRRHFENITLTLIHDTVHQALSSMDFRADAWFLDGFSPAKNADMWSPSVMFAVARLSASNARLATFTVAGAVRRALSDAGFEVERKEGFGRKRHRLEAHLAGNPLRPSKPAVPTIIGSGIAGASIARAFLRRGIKPQILFDQDHIEASGNGVAIIKPRLDLQDHPSSRFFLSSFLYAREAYRDCVIHEGLTHRPKTDAEAKRFAKLAAQQPLGPGHLIWEDEALHMPSALTINTQAARAQLLGDVEPSPRAISSLEDLNGPLILATGYGIRSLLPDTTFRYSRGQLSWVEGDLDAPLTYGGYAVPVEDRILLGATHDRVTDHERVFDLRDEDDAHNLAMARDHGVRVEGPARGFRASVRVNTADTLPRLFCLNEKTQPRAVWGLSGLGSRGFVFAPLLGEALVCACLGEPSPLDRALRDRLGHLPEPER